MSHEHDHGGPTGVDVEAEAARGLRGLGTLLLVVGALCLSGGLWLLLRTQAPTVPQRLELARAALGEGDADTALRQAEQATEQAPEDAGTWLVRGQALRALGRIEAARDCLERACELAPDRWEAQVERARVHLALGDDEQARAAWEAARALAPDEPAVQELGASLGR